MAEIHAPADLIRVISHELQSCSRVDDDDRLPYLPRDAEHRRRLIAMLDSLQDMSELEQWANKVLAPGQLAKDFERLARDIVALGLQAIESLRNVRAQAI